MDNYDSNAQSAGAYVAKENGQWVVYVTVVAADAAVSEHRIASYYSESQAKLAAKWMGWSANRKIPTPRIKIQKKTESESESESEKD